MNSTQNFWKERSVLVTGAAGFIGAHLCRALRALGADVVGLDLGGPSAICRVLGIADVKWISRDIRDADRMAWAVAHGNGQTTWRPPEVVYHLAGASHIRWSQEHPREAWEANIQGTWNLLEACRALPQGQIKAVVCASSNHVFGSLPKALGVPTDERGARLYPAIRQDSLRTRFSEDDPCGQTDVYGVSKGCVDLLTKAYGAMGLPVAALRHVNAFGPADPHASHLVTATILSLLDGRPPTITGDGTAIKGYLYVDAVVEAYLHLAEALAAGTLPRGATVNAGAPPISVVDLVGLLVEIHGGDRETFHPVITAEDLSQSGYVEILGWPTLEALGWMPGALTQGLRLTYDWYRQYGGLAWLSA